MLQLENTAQTCVMMFVKGMKVDIAYALRGLFLQLSGMQAFRQLSGMHAFRIECIWELQGPGQGTADCNTSNISIV